MNGICDLLSLDEYIGREIRNIRVDVERKEYVIKQTKGRRSLRKRKPYTTVENKTIRKIKHIEIENKDQEHEIKQSSVNWYFAQVEAEQERTPMDFLIESFGKLYL